MFLLQKLVWKLVEKLVWRLVQKLVQKVLGAALLMVSAQMLARLPQPHKLFGVLQHHTVAGLAEG